MTEELNLMDKIIEAKDANPTAKVLFVEDVKEVMRRLKNEVGCGKDIGGWNCGEFFEHETDDEGRSLGRKYYCDNCNKLLQNLNKLAGEKLIN